MKITPSKYNLATSICNKCADLLLLKSLIIFNEDIKEGIEGLKLEQ